MFGYTSLSGAVAHFNDEGTPSRLTIGAGQSLFERELAVMTGLVYSHYDVNAEADNNPSQSIKGGTSHSLGIDVMLRWSFMQTRYASYHIEGGGGFQYMLTNPPFPADGSDENFTLFFGPGTLIPTSANTRMRVALQWFHISNANLFANNSGYDGLQLVVGFEWGL